MTSAVACYICKVRFPRIEEKAKAPAPAEETGKEAKDTGSAASELEKDTDVEMERSGDEDSASSCDDEETECADDGEELKGSSTSSDSEGNRTKRRKPPQVRLDRGFGWGTMPLRTREETLADGTRYAGAKTKKERERIARDTGTRNGVIMRVPGFHAARMAPVDPFHNIYEGSAKVSFWTN